MLLSTEQQTKHMQFTFIFRDKGRIRAVIFKQNCPSVIEFSFIVLLIFFFTHNPPSLCPFLPLPSSPLSLLRAPLLVDRCEMPAVRVTDAVSPLWNHVSEATSHQHVHGCLCGHGVEREKDGAWVFALLYLREWISACGMGALRGILVRWN